MGKEFDGEDDADTDALLNRISDQLATRFAGSFSPETVECYVRESYLALYRTSRIKTHLHVLTQRFATDRLTALAQAKGFIPKTVCEVLFVCTHNAGRSQMAAALMNHHAQGRVHVRTAGSQPAAEVEPVVLAVLAEVGVDASADFPKPLTDDVVRAADVIVTMGCGDACPIHPGKRYLDWDLTDPQGKTVEEVRRIRDLVDEEVRRLLGQLSMSRSR